jgi:predicted DNA-binding transcriptional regulator YafY
MRASRLLTLVGLLQARGRMSTTELAAELEVSARTVLRDLEALSSAGIPVYATRGRHGGFALLDGFTGERAGGPRRAAPALAPAGPPPRALIRISPRGRRLAALLGRPEGLRLRRQQSTEVTGLGPGRGDRADWAQAWIRFGDAGAAVLDLLALGPEVEVLQPPELRRELGRAARRIAELQAGPGA